jgi:hypothetical protein
MPTPKQYATSAERQRAYRQRQAQALHQHLKGKGLPASASLATLPSQARWRALHQQATTALHTLHTEMQDYYQARSEVWQESERGETFLERQEALESLLEELDACF